MTETFQIWIRRIQGNRDVVLLLIVGFLVIGMADWLFTQSYVRDQEYRQTLMAQQLQARVHALLEEHVTALTALNVVYQNFVDITHYDFQQYGKSITSNLNGFRRLYYVDPNMSVRHVYPLSSENKDILGLSLKNESDIVSVFEQSRITKKPATTPLLNFLDNSRNLLAVIPIYRNDREFLGYAVGEIDLEKIWEMFSQVDFLSRYQVQMLDSEGTSFFSGLNLSLLDRPQTQVSFMVGDKQWKLLLQSVQPIYQAIVYQRLGLWGTGLLILLLMHLLISGSRRHRDALSEIQSQFESIFYSSPDGMLLLNDKLQVQLSNKPVQEWLNTSDEPLRSKNFLDLFACQCPHYAKCKELSYLLCTSEQFEETLPETLEVKLVGGGNKTLRLNASRLQQRQRGGPVDKFICVLGDISTSKELERVKENFVATLTHDLKTPLLAQEMVLETVMSGSVGEVSHKQQRLLQGALDSSQDLLEMVNSTLLFYKLESAHLSLELQRVSLAPLIKEILASLRPLAEKRNIQFELDLAIDLPPVSVDLIQIKRVFHNIISNAISYANRNTPVQIRVRQVESSIQVEVRNQGKGIPAEELSRIFEKYHSLSRRFKQIGTGLGLYISRRIVELHGGKIWAESEPDRETCFYISLPRPEKV